MRGGRAREIARRIGERRRNRAAARAMHDEVGIIDAGERFGADVGGPPLGEAEAALRRRRPVAMPDAGDAPPRLSQTARDMAAEKAVRAGDESFHEAATTTS